MSYFNSFQKVQYDLRGDGFYQTLTNLTHFTTIGTKYLDDMSFYSYYNINNGDRPDNVSYRLYGTTDYYWTFFIVNKKLNNVYQDWPKNQSDIKEFTEEKYSNLAAISAPVSTYFDPIADKFDIGETVQGGVTGSLGTVVAKYPTLGYVEIKPISGTFLSTGEGIYGLTNQDFLTTSAIVKRAYAPKYHVDVSTGDQVMRRVAGTIPVTNYEWESDQNLLRSRIQVIKPQFIVDVARAFSKEMKSKKA